MTALNPITAAQFYAAAKPATEPDPAAGSPTGSIGEFAASFTQTLSEGENTAKAALSGNADMPALVEALAKTELAVETAVTIRNKVVEAYQEILRMPV
jgi:flagellar hook-basal body complex protein FliE